MKLKIIIVLLILLCSINTVSSENLDEGIFTDYSFEHYTSDCNGNDGGGTIGFQNLSMRYSENFQDGFQYIYVDIPNANFVGTYKSTYDSYFENIILKEENNFTASGKTGYYKKENGDYRLWMWLDLSTWDYTGSGYKEFGIYGHTRDYYKVNDLRSVWYTGTNPYHLCFNTGTTHYFGYYTYYIDMPYSFKNSYYTTKDDTTMYNIFINKSISGYNCLSIIKITDSTDYILLNETSFNTNDLELSYYNSNTPYLIECENYINTTFSDYLYFLTPDEPDIIGTLETDKTYYNMSMTENITISFTDIDLLYDANKDKHLYQKPYNLYILYSVTDAYKQYETKYIYPLLYSLEDETFTLKTNFLTPQTNYVLGIVGKNGHYSQHDDILIFSDEFYVYPSDEYLTTSCTTEGNCYTYNGDTITIYYKVNNVSSLSIKDSNNVRKHKYSDINGTGSLIYNIPYDENQINNYPNWKVYMNQTGGGTSYVSNFTVYWSSFIEPTPIPTPQPTEPINETVDEMIDDLKTETKPIFDLIYGLTTIVIDNPDYDKDNIVDEHELNNWFNSMVPLVIFLFLVILYMGLTKRGKK